MTRLAATVMMTALVSIGWAPPLFAYERGPVCREQSVVDEMTRLIRATEYYSEVDPGLVTEQPTVDPRVVRCQVCVQLAPYDTMRFGEHPVVQCRAHGFDVEIFPAGFVVRDRG